jgi:hypothetical protein
LIAESPVGDPELEFIERVEGSEVEGLIAIMLES